MATQVAAFVPGTQIKLGIYESERYPPWPGPDLCGLCKVQLVPGERFGFRFVDSDDDRHLVPACAEHAERS
jgi:hypothetical protein